MNIILIPKILTILILIPIIWHWNDLSGWEPATGVWLQNWSPPTPRYTEPCYTALRYTALCYVCATLHCTKLHCATLHYATLHSSSLHQGTLQNSSPPGSVIDYPSLRNRLHCTTPRTSRVHLLHYSSPHEVGLAMLLLYSEMKKQSKERCYTGFTFHPVILLHQNYIAKK